MSTAPKFDSYALPNDTITIEDGLFTFTARIEHDDFIRNPEDEDEGISPEALEAWRNDEWFYCGIVISASYNGVDLDDCCASLWGIECNFPGSDNSYLGEVVQELLPEAREAANNALELFRNKLAA